MLITNDFIQELPKHETHKQRVVKVFHSNAITGKSEETNKLIIRDHDMKNSKNARN